MNAPELDMELLASAIDAIPVFPLPGVVLFPGAILPLHIFEPRYRTMLADVMATHRCLVMAFAVGGERGQEPSFAPIGGAAIVVRHEPLPDGRSNIELRGVARVAIEELPFIPPYRRARARVLRDLDTAVPSIDATALRGTAAAAARVERATDFALPVDAPLGAAADACAHRLLSDARVRQRVLEELDVAARVRLVTAELAERLGRNRSQPAARLD